MDPKELSLPEKTVYWYLKWFKLDRGHSYGPAKQKQLALDVGVSESVISRIKHERPEWLQLGPDGRKWDVKD